MFGRVSYLTFVRTEGGAVVASYGNDKMVKLWDPATGRERSTISGVRPPMALSLDGRLLASRVAEGSGVTVVEVGTGRQVRALSGHDGQDGSVSAVVVSHDGALIVSAYRDIKVWLVETGAVIRTFEGHAGPITALALSQDGRRLASGSDGTVKVWDLATGER